MLPGLLDPWPRIRGSEYNDEDGHQRKNHQDANLIMAPRIFTFARILFQVDVVLPTRVPLIGGLPPILTLFRIISS